MRRVAMRVMHVVDVIAMLDRLVPACLTMRVVTVLTVFAVAAALALVPVSFVLNRGVAAACIVLVPRVCYGFVLRALRHGNKLILSSLR